MLMEQINSSLLAQVVSFIGLGAFLDQVAPRPLRDKVGDFIMLDRALSTREFESAVITSIVQIFTCRDDIDRISIPKVAAYSVIMSALLYWLYIDSGLRVLIQQVPPTAENIPGYAIFIILSVIILISSDYFSIYVTKRLFYFQSLTRLQFVARLLLDFVLSLLPPLFFFAATFTFVSMQGDAGLASLGDTRFLGLPILGYVFVAMYGTVNNAATSIFLTILQILIVASGLILSLLNRYLSWNEVQIERLRNVPFTLCMTLIALIELATGGVIAIFA